MQSCPVSHLQSLVSRKSDSRLTRCRIAELKIIEIPSEFNKYATNSPVHEAGFDSFLTARILTRLAAKIDGQYVLTEASKSETENQQDRPLNDGQLKPASYLDQSIEPIPSGLDVHTPKYPDAIQTTNPLKHHNTFETLALEDSSVSYTKSEAKLMMPSYNRPFWTVYGNKLRVNGTLEEVCIVGSSPRRHASFDSFEGLHPPGFWIS